MKKIKSIFLANLIPLLILNVSGKEINYNDDFLINRNYRFYFYNHHHDHLSNMIMPIIGSLGLYKIYNYLFPSVRTCSCLDKNSSLAGDSLDNNIETNSKNRAKINKSKKAKEYFNETQIIEEIKEQQEIAKSKFVHAELIHNALERVKSIDKINEVIYIIQEIYADAKEAAELANAKAGEVYYSQEAQNFVNFAHDFAQQIKQFIELAENRLNLEYAQVLHEIKELENKTEALVIKVEIMCANNTPFHEIEKAIKEIQVTEQLIDEKISSIRNNQVAKDLIKTNYKNTKKAKEVCFKN